MVISQKIDENQMEYRGSKSILFLIKIVFYLIIFYFIFYSINIDQLFILTAFSPVVVYINADQDKLKILKDNNSKSGVYRWLHKDSGKSYIGSSVNLTNRFYTYYNLKVMLKSSTLSIIARALLKYGYSNFQLEILEYCDPANCLEREQYYLDLFNPEYNILKTAGSRLGSKHSKATISKISESLLGNKRAVGGKRVLTPVEVLDNLTGLKTEYPSISEAAKALGVPSSSIRSYFSRKIQSPFKGRYVLIKLID
jgi:hypothetical protein